MPKLKTSVSCNGKRYEEGQIISDEEAKEIEDGLGDYDVNKVIIFNVGGEPAPADTGADAGAEDEQSRMEQIVAAIDLVDASVEDNWTANDMPTTKALEDILGFDITAAERDEAFALSGGN